MEKIDVSKLHDWEIDILLSCLRDQLEEYQRLIDYYRISGKLYTAQIFREASEKLAHIIIKITE